MITCSKSDLIPLGMPYPLLRSFNPLLLGHKTSKRNGIPYGMPFPRTRFVNWSFLGHKTSRRNGISSDMPVTEYRFVNLLSLGHQTSPPQSLSFIELLTKSLRTCTVKSQIKKRSVRSRDLSCQRRFNRFIICGFFMSRRNGIHTCMPCPLLRFSNLLSLGHHFREWFPSLNLSNGGTL